MTSIWLVLPLFITFNVETKAEGHQNRPNILFLGKLITKIICFSSFKGQSSSHCNCTQINILLHYLDKNWLSYKFTYKFTTFQWAVVDDLRINLGLYQNHTNMLAISQTNMHTPNIDALGARGVTFDKASCQIFNGMKWVQKCFC